jgi:hypothetical protein
MMSFLLMVGVIGFVGWLLWRARNKLRRTEEEARARETAFVQNLGLSSERASQAAPVALVAAPMAPVAVAAASAGATPAGAYLSAQNARAFRLLKTALPQHEIFPRGSLRRILGPLAPGKDLKVDFVVCSAEFRPVAVVDLVAPDDLPPVVALKTERLAAAGVAYARWDGQDLPSAASVAETLLGRLQTPDVGAASGRE